MMSQMVDSPYPELAHLKRPIIAHVEGELLGRDILDFAKEHGDAFSALANFSRSQWGIPVFVDDSLLSHLVILTCLLERIPFSVIDSSAPREHISQMLSLLGNPRYVLSGSKATTGKIPAHVREFLPGHDLPDFSNEILIQPGRESGLTIMTSGSTGTPKGIHLPFSVVDQQTRRISEEFFPGPEPPRMSSLAPLHSIAGIRRLQRSLLGTEVHVITPGRFTVRKLVEEFHRRRITQLHLPPQIARILAQHRGDGFLFLDAVTELRVGSEGIRFEVLQGLRKFLRDEVIVKHGLGATEGSTGIKHEFPLGSMPDAGQVPIGRPTRPDLVRFEAQPDFGEGVLEVVVCGPITSGYVGAEDLNAARFTTSPDGVRWWYSGDLVSLNTEGLYVHRGRKDDLVKVRGILASPSEATHALLGIEGVRAGIALPHRENDNVRLVAHFETEPDSGLTATGIRQLLRPQLPNHLMPARFIRHDSLPTNSRGKIDRARLTEMTAEDLDKA